ncbi:hypothetical protein Scep_020765 [Stephania cephalantha]|uniref:Uncharacterized protein n=1 Tax=Stephania cephalantha TaxID=152367 RepID=A0AAP0NR37_9MAGN
MRHIICKLGEAVGLIHAGVFCWFLINKVGCVFLSFEESFRLILNPINLAYFTELYGNL